MSSLFGGGILPGHRGWCWQHTGTASACICCARFGRQIALFECLSTLSCRLFFHHVPYNIMRRSGPVNPIMLRGVWIGDTSCRWLVVSCNESQSCECHKEWGLMCKALYTGWCKPLHLASGWRHRSNYRRRGKGMNYAAWQPPTTYIEGGSCCR